MEVRSGTSVGSAVARFDNIAFIEAKVLEVDFGPFGYLLLCYYVVSGSHIIGM